MDIEVLKKRVTPELERNILDWKKKPESHFTGFNEQPLEWGSRVIGNAVMFGLTDSHGMIFMPNISCDYKVKKERYTLGWVEGISMYGGGIAIVQHFALNEKITGMGLGTALFGAIARFLKSHNAIAIEFRENHSSKIEHYRSFFGKLNVAFGDLSYTLTMKCQRKFVCFMRHSKIPINTNGKSKTAQS